MPSNAQARRVAALARGPAASAELGLDMGFAGRMVLAQFEAAAHAGCAVVSSSPRRNILLSIVEYSMA